MPGVSIWMSATPAIAPRLAEVPTSRRTIARRATSVVGGAVTKEAPLAGLKVLDLGVVIAGAYAGTILASLGADVVKIEPPQGDPFRSYGTAFCDYNRAKHSLVLDLYLAEANEVCFEL